MSMRNIVPTLAAPMLLLGACTEVDRRQPGAELEEVEDLDVAIDRASGRVTAVYRTDGGDSIELMTRRVVTDVTEDGGVRTEQYIEVDPSASGFQIEVTVVDRQRGIRFLARGNRVSFDSDGASVVDKERAMALFGEAMSALAASDAAVPRAERRVLRVVPELVGFEDPILPLRPYAANDQGCQGQALAPTMNYFTESVTARGRVMCLGDGREHELKFSMCVYAKVLEVTAQSVVGGTYGSPPPVGLETELACQETEKFTFDAPELTAEVLDVGANVFCGVPRTKYSYRSELKSVTEFNSGIEAFFQGGEDWHTLEESGTLEAWCGAEPPAPFPDSEFQPWDPTPGGDSGSDGSGSDGSGSDGSGSGSDDGSGFEDPYPELPKEPAEPTNPPPVCT